MCLTFAAATGAGAHAAGADAAGAHTSSAQATRRDGIAGTTGCAGRAHSRAHCQVPTAGSTANTASHWLGAGHAEVPADDPTPGAADTCEPQSLSQNFEDEQSSLPEDSPSLASVLDSSGFILSQSCGLSCFVTQIHPAEMPALCFI